jgi:hypothetical protein
MRITTYLQSIEKKEFIINACQRSRLHKTNTSVRRGRRILLFLQRTRELVYVPRTSTVGIYLEEIGGGCCGSPLQFYNSS